MKRQMRIILVAMTVSACAACSAQDEQARSSAEDVVSNFYEHLRAGDVDAMDSLFFRIPAMENNQADWLALVRRVSQKVEDEQLDWEVVCGKELTEMAAVIVNQTMKQGRKHADPDAVYLVKKNDRWLLLPDIFAVNAEDAVRASLSDEQLNSRSTLERWALSEIRGITTECRDRE